MSVTFCRTYTPFRRNVPGVAVYFLTLTQLRTVMSQSPLFSPLARSKASSLRHPSVAIDASKPPPPISGLPKLSSAGDLIAGATARTAVGFVLMPFTVLKTRFEVSLLEHPVRNAPKDRI